MKGKTEAKLATKYKWWWRTATNDFILLPNGQTRADPNKPEPKSIIVGGGGIEYKGPPGMDSYIWKSRDEVAAWRFELVRRLHPDRKLPCWPELTIRQQDALIQCIGESYLQVVEQIHCGHLYKTSAEVVREQLADPDFTLPVCYNLWVSDSALQKQFKEFIKSERKRKGIRKPDKRKGNSVSWHWPEVWDRSEREREPLKASESSMKSKAIFEAKRRSKAVLDALSKSVPLSA